MRRPGLSRIEVAILLAMLAVLAALTLSGVQRVREAAARMSCSNNLKQIGIATQSYHDAMQRLPVDRRSRWRCRRCGQRRAVLSLAPG